MRKERRGPGALKRMRFLPPKTKTEITFSSRTALKSPDQKIKGIGILMGSGQGPVSSFFFLFLGPEAKGRRKCQVLARAPLNVALG